MRLIGLNGRMRSGKDTAVEYIRAETCGEVVRASFADKMKYSGMCALGFDPGNSVADMVHMANLLKEHGFVTTAWHENDVTVKLTVTGREFWQLYGTESHRDVFGEDFWVDALLPQPVWASSPGNSYVLAQKELERRFPDADVVVVTDVRFASEAKRVLDLGGEVWTIDASKRLGPLPSDSHSSEYGLPGSLTSATIPNNGSLEQFETTIRATWRLYNACYA